MSAPTYRFGPFDLRTSDGTLWREGAPVALTAQPARLLRLLITHHGQIVTRDVIREWLWGHTHLEVDLGINRCVREIRAALQDDPRDPIYVETLVGRGYRFVAPVRTLDTPPVASEPERGHRRAASRTPRWLGLTDARALAKGAAAIATIVGFVIVGRALGGVADRSNYAAGDDGNTVRAIAQADAYLDRRQGVAVERAVAILAELVEQSPDNAPAHARLAYAHSVLDWEWGRGGHAEPAKQHAGRVQALDRSGPPSHLAVGSIRYANGDFVGALEELRAAVALGTDEPYSGMLLGKALMGLGRWEESRAVLGRVFETHAGSFDLAHTMAWNALFLHRFDEADVHLRHMLALHPDHPLPWLIRPLIPMLRDGELDSVEARLDEGARELGVGTVMLTSRTLSRLFGQRLVNDPEPFGYERVSVQRPHYHLHRGEALWYAGAHGAAREEYGLARDLLAAHGSANRRRGGPVEPVIMLASAYAGLGDTAQALALVDRSLHELPLGLVAPDALKLRRYAAEVLARVGEHERAMDHLEFMIDGPSVVTRALLRLDPVWRELRRNGRFRGMVGESECRVQSAECRM